MTSAANGYQFKRVQESWGPSAVRGVLEGKRQRVSSDRNRGEGDSGDNTCSPILPTCHAVLLGEKGRGEGQDKEDGGQKKVFCQ